MSTASKQVALTFDDGPNPPYTNQILDILKKEAIQATFFVCGANIERHPDEIKREVTQGHQIGNHTWFHRRTSYLLGQIPSEVERTQTLINKLTSPSVIASIRREPETKQSKTNPKLFRFPWGFEFPWIKKQLQKSGYTIIHVGIFGDDWVTGITAAKIAQKVASRLKDNVIITLHDGHNTDEGVSRSETIKALPEIIKNLKQKGYQFVPTTEL